MPLPPAPTKRAALLPPDAYDAPARSSHKAARKSEAPHADSPIADKPQAEDFEPRAGGSAVHPEALQDETQEVIEKAAASARRRTAPAAEPAPRPRKPKATGPAKLFQNVDNIYVGTNYVYAQEDDNGYGDEAHDGYIYQYNIATKDVRPVIELDHRRTAADAAIYNAVGARPAGKAGWEYGAMVDVSAELGQENTFMLSLQPHSWRGTKYQGVDGGTVRPTENQASQLVIVKGLPR